MLMNIHESLAFTELTLIALCYLLKHAPLASLELPNKLAYIGEMQESWATPSNDHQDSEVHSQV